MKKLRRDDQVVLLLRISNFEILLNIQRPTIKHALPSAKLLTSPLEEAHRNVSEEV